jgi:hypothetical protein
MDNLPGFGDAALMHMTRSTLVIWRLFLGTAAACASSGCKGLDSGSAGNLRSQSMRSDAVTLAGDYGTAVFTNDKIAGTSIMLADVPVEQLLRGEVENGQIMHIELLWLPKAGDTPMDAAATNASIRHIVISNGEVGIYGGAGFALPSDDPYHHDSISVTVRDASLSLQEATAGFVDLLSPAQLTGTFKATRNDRRSRELYFAASQLVTNALGRTRYVSRGFQTTTTGVVPQ